ncbi:MAG: hypothetical protein J3Q66DRAFT_415009 [Benniella sp.]|nr:MAG: hypothetical protein J3Q66DRAFT_415009 [Benniella sp.]
MVFSLGFPASTTTTFCPSALADNQASCIHSKLLRTVPTSSRGLRVVPTSGFAIVPSLVLSLSESTLLGASLRWFIPFTNAFLASPLLSVLVGTSSGSFTRPQKRKQPVKAQFTTSQETCIAKGMMAPGIFGPCYGVNTEYKYAGQQFHSKFYHNFVKQINREFNTSITEASLSRKMEKMESTWEETHKRKRFTPISAQTSTPPGPVRKVHPFRPPSFERPVRRRLLDRLYGIGATELRDPAITHNASLEQKNGWKKMPEWNPFRELAQSNKLRSLRIKGSNDKVQRASYWQVSNNLESLDARVDLCPQARTTLLRQIHKSEDAKTMPSSRQLTFTPVGVAHTRLPKAPDSWMDTTLIDRFPTQFIDH